MVADFIIWSTKKITVGEKKIDPTKVKNMEQGRRNVNGQWLCLGLEREREREREDGENGSVREIRRPIGSE